MNFDFTDDQTAFSDAVRGFARTQLANGALERAHDPNYSFELARKLAAQGLLGIIMPEKDGGAGGTLMDAVIAIQELAAVCPKSADVVQAGNFGAIRTFAEYADEEQKTKWLSGLLSGDKLIGLGMSEPGAGSEVTALQTSAVAEGDEYIINGTKIFSTHSADATLYLVYVRFGPGLNGIGSVLIERGTPGLTIGSPSTFMSGEQWCQLYFENCRIPKSHVLLGEGGFKKQISGFNVERIGNSARSLAVGRHAFDIARAHVLERRQFGRPIAEFQGLQWQFADVAVKMEAAQMLLYRAAVNADRGLPSAYETSAAKYACNQAGFEAANLAVQAMGGTGYSSESIVEYCFRRTRGWMIAGGSTEVLKNRIAEEVFGRRFDQRPARG
ncbi:acyl-CoA dehydrogenase family protein [Sphingopyxis terrae]|uniref:acyl-CoA dehydrogenase family protein n=1 Tax=Sphingopyxis terrae TaxID=33052 RepID=UPI002A1449DF|nr:acyl-CoA dehydrogenase family protein [Sphingopyxis terrae]MDX8356427.1 acyl-CoA dehydrogenase family protein [Sphingopyxis terrae]